MISQRSLENFCFVINVTVGEIEVNDISLQTINAVVSQKIGLIPKCA